MATSVEQADQAITDIMERKVFGQAGAQHIVLIGTMPPVAPFAYPDKPGYLAPDAATTHVLARPEQDVADALARLADELGREGEESPLTFSAKGAEAAELTARDIGFDATGARFTIRSPEGELEVRTPLPGDFNVENALAALAYALEHARTDLDRVDDHVRGVLAPFHAAVEERRRGGIVDDDVLDNHAPHEDVDARLA